MFSFLVVAWVLEVLQNKFASPGKQELPIIYDLSVGFFFWKESLQVFPTGIDAITLSFVLLSTC